MLPFKKIVTDLEHRKACWFSKKAMGKNTLGNIVKRLAEKGGLSGRKTNRSTRKTTVASLLHSDVEATKIMQLTGHRNVQSINDYITVSLKKQQHMSNIMSDIGSGSAKTNYVSIESTHTTTCTGNRDTVESRSEIAFEENIDSDLLNLDFENVQEITNQISKYERNENISVNLPVNSCETAMNKENICSHPRFSMTSNASIGNVTINIYGDNFKNP